MHKPRILLINGSPRKGNTHAMASEFAKGARKAGAVVQVVNLSTVNFSGCCGWSDCYYENYCIVHDAFINIHKKMLQADAYCFASPNYFNSVSGLFKNFIDRTNPYTRPPLYKGTPTALLCVGGFSHDAVKQLEDYLREFCRIQKLPVKGSVGALADAEGEVKQQPKTLEKCRALGARMASIARKHAPA